MVEPPAVDLSRFPRVALGNWPTPLEECPRLTKVLGPRVLVKRDDVNGLGVGGNKLRKLEFLLGAAVAEGADTIVTFGGVQTNHGRLTAAACARLGLRCELVLTRQVTRLAGSDALVAPQAGEAYEQSGNVALDRIYGAHVHVCDDDTQAEATADRIVAAAKAQGREVVRIPVGGSNAVGVLGYLTAAVELAGQLELMGERADRIVCAIGSAGTVAGLALGSGLLRWPVTVDAVSVSGTESECRADVDRLVRDASELIGVDPPAINVQVTDRAVGDGYGVTTAAMWDAVRLFGRTEGITLDPVYTGKAAAALVEAVRGGEISDSESVVFLHTGGLPGLFGYVPELIEQTAG
ncbi:D-cysteine desulfhydrase family protein [Nocardia aurantia]|uniref:D-cysteine desulfhydrase n=1 Tax=Nocardia aurantia TaxID=2585199 RepID=A0A7K0DNE0_9NOCA|nr:D-cysteine desulfhydrase family protein [Nocardia aurantia]MQY26324.1 D-cysteine desulfhydrase [Nocardia aurantia]